MSFFKELEHLRIPFEDIVEATKNFTTIIGRGGYGPVYTGKLSLSGNLISVAVKRLPFINLSGQGLKEFLTEINLLSRYKHPNLVSLLGYCEEGNEKILIYEYAEHGSLDRHLNTAANTTCPLTWTQRISICIDAARGLDYLHNHVGANHRVIHRDIKSANILLDKNWKAMIADLGLSKIGRANEHETYLITNGAGTHYYCDPAYINTGILTKESDVYSFGVVLFEVLCGRLCFMDVIGEQRNLVPLAQKCYEEGKLNEIMDLDMINSESVKEFSDIAYQCLHNDQKGRPSMTLVLQKLEKALELHESEEAFELRKLEGALGLQKLVVTLQVEEYVEAMVLHKHEDILDLQRNYAVLKAVQMMTKNPLVHATNDELYEHVSNGILVDEGNVWFSLDANGNYQEMISAMNFMHPHPNKYEVITLRESCPTCRFPKVVKIFNTSMLNMEVKIRTQFLSSGVTYAAYLRCKHKYSADYPVIRSLKYRLNNQSQSYKSHRGDYKDGWMMLELFQTTSTKRDVEFKVLLQGFSLANFLGDDEVIIEGIMFSPVQKSDDEIIKDQNLENWPTTELEWRLRLPSDYEQFVRSGTNMVKRLRNYFITETKEAAFYTLNAGVHIRIEGDIDVWFWITKSNGNKCFMLSPNSIQASSMKKLKVKDRNESRFKHVLEMNSNLNDIKLSFKIRSPLLSSNTTYACYLVYKIYVHLQNPFRVTIKQRMLKPSRRDNDSRNNHRRYNQENFVYLSLPQTPIIEPDGALRSCGTMSKPETIEFPRKREDGWWEVRLGEFITHEQLTESSHSRSSTNVPTFRHANVDVVMTKYASLCPDYHPVIDIHMCWLDRITKLKLCKYLEIPKLTMQGIEFRPM